MKVYTRTGDDGTTGLFYGGRVPKNAGAPSAYGAVDELQAFLGLARAEVADDAGELGALLVALAGDLWVVMAELATDPVNHAKLTPGATQVTAAMVTALEGHIDTLSERFDPPTDFVVPGGNRIGALLDVARTVARRAEREALPVAVPGSNVVPYLNRLSDLLWTMARWQEGDSLLAKDTRPAGP